MIMFNIYLVLAILTAFISFIAIYKSNYSAGLYFNEWISVLFIGLLWPIFWILFAYDVYAKRRLAKAEDKSGKCGCGCGKEAKE